MERWVGGAYVPIIPAPGKWRQEEQGNESWKTNFFYIISVRPGYMRPYLKIPAVCFGVMCYHAPFLFYPRPSISTCLHRQCALPRLL